jgi:hypothetical protein
VILSEVPVIQPGGFFPDPLFVVTPHVGELSWLFVQLRDIAYGLDGYGLWKEEFFGRLGTAANAAHTSSSIEELLLATLREAYELLGMVEIGMKMNDWTPVIIHPRNVGADIETFDRAALQSFFESRGIALP